MQKETEAIGAATAAQLNAQTEQLERVDDEVKATVR